MSSNLPVRPPALVSGDCIGVIGLSSPCVRAGFERGVAYLESQGYRVKVALDPCADYGSPSRFYPHVEPGAVAAAFHELFTDKDVRAVLSARGGYGSARLLPFIDFNLLRASPKIFSGFSDSTAMLLALHQAGIESVHGPSLEATFGRAEEKPEAKASAAMLLQLLAGQCRNPFADVKLKLLCGTGVAEGPLCGGNLATLVSLIGTPWEPDLSGKIFFFEETCERPYRLHRMLLQLKLAGKLKSLRGVLVGSLKDCTHPQGHGPDAVHVIRELFSEFDYPVYGGAPFGHEPYNLPLPLGLPARLGGNALDILESAVL